MSPTSSGAFATVSELQRRIAVMQPQQSVERALPTHPGLAPLLAGGALRQGASYSVRGSLTLALASVAAASQEGAWCGVVGCEAFGAEAAVALGVALDRLVLVPRPGPHALGLAASLAEVLSIVVLALPEHTAGTGLGGRATPSNVARIAAKLRQHGATLVVIGNWPHAETELTVTGRRWHGLGRGRGMLDSCDLSVRSRDRRGTRQHILRFSDGALTDPTRSPVERLASRRVPQ